MLDEYNPFSSDTTFLDQVISDLIDETIEARGIVPGGFEIEVSELTLPFCWWRDHDSESFGDGINIFDSCFKLFQLCH